MNTINVAPKSIDAVIISSYCYDEPMTDMNCAWYTVYTIYEVASGNIRTIKCGTGWGENLDDINPELNIIPITEDIKVAYKKSLKEEQYKNSIALYNKYLDEIADYNKSLRPQKKGQKVFILDGRRKGKVCTISWIGKGKKFGFDAKAWYRKSYPMATALLMCLNNRPFSIPEKDANLIRVWPEDGTKPFYIDIEKAKVVEGFEPVTLTYEDAFRYNRNFNDIFIQKWHNGYNERNYID